MVSAILFTVISTASATVIDFRENPWNDAFGDSTYSYTFNTGDLDGLTINLSTSPGGATIWQDNVDGLGVVNRWENDEIEWDELLKISFSSIVTIQVISIADLFIESGYSETGLYSLDNGLSWIRFEAIERGGNGELKINPRAISINSIWFTGDQNSTYGKSEFAVQNIDVVLTPKGTVPEPSPVLLIGLGLLCLSVTHKRKAAKFRA